MTDLCSEIEKFGKGIGNTNRYHLLEALLAGPLTVTDLSDKVGLSQPAVSQHLKVLKENNLVTDTRNGKEIYYSLNTHYVVTLLTRLITQMRNDKQKKK
jgi:ArsR family transcriptional regulator